MTDSEYLTLRLPDANNGKLYDFTERVSIKVDSGIDEDAARDQAYREMIK